MTELNIRLIAKSIVDLEEGIGYKSRFIGKRVLNAFSEIVLRLIDKNRYDLIKPIKEAVISERKFRHSKEWYIDGNCVIHLECEEHENYQRPKP